jgi:hypothetical protein
MLVIVFSTARSYLPRRGDQVRDLMNPSLGWEFSRIHQQQLFAKPASVPTHHEPSVPV